MLAPMLDPLLQRRIDDQLRLAQLARAILPQAAAPYYAHMRLDVGGRVRDVLLGAETRTEGGLAIIDWRAAPLAEVFFTSAEGDDYEIEADERMLTGTLLERNLVEFSQGELSAIETSEGRLWRRDGQWQGEAHGKPSLALRPEEARLRMSSPADVVLDAAQQRIADLPAGQAVLLLGEAGFGKTTVALHRLARLRERSGPELRAAVIVPTEGLRRLSAALLERMGVARVEVWLYDRWAATQARRVFRKLPERESQDASAAVIRIKRDPGLRALLAELSARRPGRIRHGQRTRRRDLLHLFGDRLLMEKLAASSAQGIGAGMVAEVLEHTHVQFSDTAEDEFAHVDAERLQTLDGRSLDDGTPFEDAGTVDAEDYAILFELDRLRAERASEPPAQPQSYDCLVLDEAQEFAPLELALMGRALAPGGSLIVAGDAAQQVDPSACFAGWTGTMADLGCGAYETAVLEISYRCPPDVTELSRRILDGGVVPWPPGPSVACLEFANECHQADWLTRELRELHATDPCASAAIICRTPEVARRLAQHLRRGLGLRLALGGDYQFVGGLNLTCVPEAKGLEFDYVVIPDASATVYPATPAARRALYVAATRASHQLILSTVGPWTEILRH
jgi:DNA helicase-2/ATP-dependent DNA helicase PcrA